MPNSMGLARPAIRPAAYFITFACYGAKLHGEHQFAADQHRNEYRSAYAHAAAGPARFQSEALRDEPYLLSHAAGRVALASIRRTCEYERFLIHAAHVRANQVHVVADGNCTPEILLETLKAHASRDLDEWDGAERKRWAPHGSTLWLWTPQEVDMAVNYVLKHQGEPIACYENPCRWSI